MLNHISTSPSSLDEINRSEDHHHRKKRVGRACDSCRIKKTKCDGVKPCSRCVQDNKVCVFSEKKKQRDKSHPSGYVELLETRLDLLTKSIEKVILLARPHLPFLGELVQDKDAIPINDVISYMISKEGLLRNLPVEWEEGAMIAANVVTDDKRNVENASHSFSEHKQNKAEEDEERILLSDSQPRSNTFSRENSGETSPSVRNEDPLQLNNFSLGGNSTAASVLSASQSLNGRKFSFSDLDSDSNSLTSQQASVKTDDTSVDSTSTNSIGSNSLFPTNINFDSRKVMKSKNNSMVSLTTKFQDHGLHSPTLASFNVPKSQIAQQGKHQQQNHLRRSSSIQRPFSPTYSKFKNNGHVSKPTRNHNHHSSGSIVINNESNLDLPRRPSGLQLPSSLPPSLDDFENLFESFNSAGSLPSDAFKLANYNNYSTSEIISNDDIDAFLITNPFMDKP